MAAVNPRTHPDPVARTGDGTPGSTADDAFSALVVRLSRQSVEKHFDAYDDVDWDAPEMRIDTTDTRWALPPIDALAQTDWYRAQPPEVQARIGLHRVAVMMRTGWEFENILQRGLLSYAFWLPNGRPEFRYVHHEVAEESQHTLMFQELVNRTGLPVKGMPARLKVAAELLVIPLARRFPALFFFFVLGGEDPIDHVQRLRLRTGIPHPLLERIMRIHVTEEARHVSFARRFIEREVPRLPAARRRILSVAVPALLGVMARLMLSPPSGFARANGIPLDVARRAVRDDIHRALLRQSVAKVRRLCSSVGLLGPVPRVVWRACGIWDDPAGG